jgi:hypothetical protein
MQTVEEIIEYIRANDQGSKQAEYNKYNNPFG